MVIKVSKLKHMRTVLPEEPKPIQVPDELPKLHGLFGFFGVRGSGKTVSMTTLLHKYRDAGLLQRCFLISPTYKSNEYLFNGLVESSDVHEDANQGSLDKVLQEVESEAKVWRRWQDHCTLWDEYKKQEREFMAGNRQQIDEELTYEMIECGLLDLPGRPQYRYGDIDHPHFVLVIDDCQSSAIFNPSTKTANNLANIMIKHRHLFGRCGLSIMLAMQSWKMQTGAIGRALRQNLTCIVLWGMRDEKLLADIHQEIGREVSKEQFYETYDYATSGEKFNHLVVEFGSRIRLRRNWDEILELGDLGKFSQQNSNGVESGVAGSDGRAPSVDHGA